jgi:hypothetical protein
MRLRFLCSLLRLEEAGYVKDIILGADDTGSDIRTKITINFSHIEPLLEHGFRLLVTQKQMRLDRLGQMIPKPGVPRIFRVYKRDSELDMTAIKV